MLQRLSLQRFILFTSKLNGFCAHYMFFFSKKEIQHELSKIKQYNNRKKCSSNATKKESKKREPTDEKRKKHLSELKERKRIRLVKRTINELKQF